MGDAGRIGGNVAGTSVDTAPAAINSEAQNTGKDAVRIGRDQTPLSEGGKPFKTRKAAGDAKKLQPMMRVVSVEGGYALAEKTPAQLAAEERASRRLRNPNTSARGEPIPAHAFIAAAGGLNRVAASDMGVDGNPRIGNRTLFAGQGRGLSMEQATQMLIQDGYLSEGASINDALALIKTSLTRPQYNADGIERIAEAEAQAQFDDYLAAQEEAAAEGDADPFGMANEFTAEELDEVGYTDADPALQAEVAAYIELHADQVDEHGHRLVVRNGSHAAREVATAAGAVPVQAPRVNDKRIDEATGQRRRFASAILPAWARKSPQVADVLPLLYLHGLSSGDFAPALEQFCGSAAGLSAATITRLTGQWQDEADAFGKRSLRDVDYVYVWVDGIHVKVRLDTDKICLLVMIGVRTDGHKELIALSEPECGSRESELISSV